jgi:prevent-host-death family protein
MVMSERLVTATRFKAQCLGLLDEVARTGKTLVVTKHGKPVARVSPAEPVSSLTGSVSYLVEEAELLAPVGEQWNATAE